MGRKKSWVLGSKQKKAIAFVCKGYSMKTAAEIAGVHRCTLWRWMQRPEAQAYYAQCLFKGDYWPSWYHIQ